ncbi:jg12882 [Pararge aegeria aegeria]|uniref:Jg12882 protein n=1 Tax=Pararge aegeria aegeria TaxID=348720 RepID=A0A8S4RXE5_9NEOP|nr:jg12882 [Pararge aegeria aegeria]
MFSKECGVHQSALGQATWFNLFSLLEKRIIISTQHQWVDLMMMMKKENIELILYESTGDPRAGSYFGQRISLAI